MEMVNNKFLSKYLIRFLYRFFTTENLIQHRPPTLVA